MVFMGIKLGPPKICMVKFGIFMECLSKFLNHYEFKLRGKSFRTTSVSQYLGMITLEKRGGSNVTYQSSLPDSLQSGSFNH